VQIVVAIVPINIDTAETCPKFESAAGLLELGITLDIVGDGDEDTIEMEDVWIRVVIAEDCMVHVIDKRLEFAVDEATA
jgi:hypothetical protein